MLSALAYDERPHPPIYDLRPLSRWLHGVRMSVLHSVVGDLQRKKRPRKHRKSWFQLHWVGLGWVLGRALVSMFRLSPVRFSMLRLSPVRFGSARFGSVRFGSVRFRSALGLVCFTWLHSGSVPSRQRGPSQCDAMSSAQAQGPSSKEGVR